MSLAADRSPSLALSTTVLRMAGMSGSSMARSSATLAVPFGRPLGLPDMPDWNRMSPSTPVIFLFYQDTWTASAEDAAGTFLTTAMFNAPLIGGPTTCPVNPGGAIYVE